LSENNIISFEIEKRLLTQGYNFIAGIDEAGRGALAGPLVVGLVIFSRSYIYNPSQHLTDNVRDSKKLSPPKRTEALQIIEKAAIYSDIAVISHDTVDKLNVNAATEHAILLLLKKADPVPDIIIMDGNFKFKFGIPYHSIIKGDEKSFTIASGSIAAKVNRDKLMKQYDKKYPGYSFSKNMGYGTREHLEAISRKGPSEIHRKSYKPVSELYNLLAPA